MLRKIHTKLERLCVKTASASSKARRENKEYKFPWWWCIVNKSEFKLRKFLYKKKV
jgi:hypothetical protein